MNQLDPLDIPDLLANLVDRSLVICDAATGRYHMSESMRAYALDHLADEVEQLRKNHFNYFQRVAEKIQKFNAQRNFGDSFDLYVADSDNFRAALEWITKHDPKMQLHFVTCLAQPWFRVFTKEAHDVLIQALNAAPYVDDEDHMWAALTLAYMQIRMGDPTDTEEVLLNALRFANDQDLALAQMSALLLLSWHYAWTGKWDKAASHSASAIEIAKIHGANDAVATGCVHLGEVARQEENWELAEKSYLEAIAYGLEHSPVSAIARFNLGCIAIQTEKIDAAERYFSETLDISRKYKSTPSDASDGILGLGFVAVHRGDYRRGGLLMGYSQGNRERKGIALDPIDTALYERYFELGRSNGDPHFSQAYEQGKTLNRSQVLDLIDSS